MENNVERAPSFTERRGTLNLGADPSIAAGTVPTWSEPRRVPSPAGISIDPLPADGAVRVAPTRKQRAAPRVYIRAFTPVRLTSEIGPQSARLTDASPWGLGLAELHGPYPSVGRRVQVAFGLDRWAIRRSAEVRRSADGRLGLALADPLPAGLRDHLLDRRLPRLAPSGAMDAQARPESDASAHLQRTWRTPDGQPVGQLGLLRCRGTTWIAHHLAARQRHPDALLCCRDLYALASTAALYTDGSAAQLLAFYPPDGVEHARLCDGFAAWLNRPELATAQQIERLNAVDTPAPARAVTIRPPDADACAALSVRLSVELGTLVPAALAWNEAHFAAIAQATDGSLECRRLFEVATDRRHGYVLLERTVEPDAPRIAWVFAEPDGDWGTLRAGIAEASLATRIDAQVVLTPPSPRPIAGALRTGLMAWSAAGLRHFDNYLSTMFPDLGPLGG